MSADRTTGAPELVTVDHRRPRVPGRRPGATCSTSPSRSGFDLPFFCWHPLMGSIGACRQCAVRLYWTGRDGEEKSEIAMACMTEAQEGTRIDIDDEEAVRFRAGMIELMMLSHPHDCPVCDEGGECHLQDMTVMTGHSYRRYAGLKRTFANQDLGPFVTHEMNRCITCYRCTRFYNDYAGGHDFGVFGLRNQIYFGRDQRRHPRERVQRQPRGGLPHRRVHRQDARRPLLAQVGPADGAVGVPSLRPRLLHDAGSPLRRAAARASAATAARSTRCSSATAGATATSTSTRRNGSAPRAWRGGRRHRWPARPRPTRGASRRWTRRPCCCGAAARSASARRAPRSRTTTRCAHSSARTTSSSGSPRPTTTWSATSSRRRAGARGSGRRRTGVPAAGRARRRAGSRRRVRARRGPHQHGADARPYRAHLAAPAPDGAGGARPHPPLERRRRRARQAARAERAVDRGVARRQARRAARPRRGTRRRTTSRAWRSRWRTTSDPASPVVADLERRRSGLA